MSADPNAFNYSAQHMRDYWHVVVPNDTRVEDIGKSVFWQHVLGRLRPMAIVDIVTQDGLLDMQVRIEAVQNGIVRLHERFRHEDVKARKAVFDEYAAANATADSGEPEALQALQLSSQTPPGYKVGWNPGSKTFYVQLKANGQKLRENEPNKVKALEFAWSHARATGAVSENDKAA